MSHRSFNYPTTLSSRNCLTYSLPQVTVFWLVAPIGVIQGVYAKYYALSLTTLAGIILFARIFDAVTDPLVGFYSDRYYQRFGTRKPFMLVGGLLLIVSSYLLYVPQSIGVAYFIGCFVIFYAAYTLFEIPHNAWGTELATQSKDKSLIYTCRSVANYMGLTLFYVVPLLPIFESNEITPETLKLNVLVAGTLMILFLYFSLQMTPNTSAKPNKPGHISKLEVNQPSSPQGLSGLIVTIIHNRPLVIFLGAYLFYGVAIGMWYGLIFLYVDTYLGMGDKFVKMFLVAFILGIVVSPLWAKMAIAFGKKKVVSVAVTLVFVSFIFTGTLKPNETSFQEIVMLKVVNSVGIVCLSAIVPAMLSEISDYTAWKFRAENNAICFALLNFVTKFSSAIGTSLGLAIAGSYGFDAAASIQTSEGVQGLILGMVWWPAFLILLSLALIIAGPINTARYEIVRRRLDVLFVRR